MIPLWLYRSHTVAPLGRGGKHTLLGATQVATNKTETRTAPELRETPALEGDELSRAQAWFEDKVVRAVREAGHCVEALSVMDAVFGKPLDTVGVYDVNGHYGSGEGTRYTRELYPAYLDSDGEDCWGNVWRDLDGYDRNGMNREGWDKDGFDKDGFDAGGFNREGVDRDGLSKDDPARFKYNSLGFDIDGYDRSGFNQDGFNREGLNRLGQARDEALYAYDKNGYNVAGFNAQGYNRDGGYSARQYMAARVRRS
jgi:hypothetical protein